MDIVFFVLMTRMVLVGPSAFLIDRSESELEFRSLSSPLLSESSSSLSLPLPLLSSSFLRLDLSSRRFTRRGWLGTATKVRKSAKLDRGSADTH